jgi:hypothetical protein
MKSMEILQKYSDELDFDCLEMATEFLDGKGLGDELEAWIREENKRLLLKPKCSYCRERSTSRNKVHAIPNTDIHYCINCRSEAADDAEIQLKW